MQTRGEWSADLTRSIAKNLRRCRKAKRWSARELSETCDILGLPIPRTTISDLENGRRLFLDVAELLMLARALEVSPAELVFPQDQDEYMSVSPAEMRTKAEAAMWWGGKAKIAGVAPMAVWGYAARAENDPQSLFGQHERLVKAIRYCCRCVRSAPNLSLADEARVVLQSESQRLSRLRQDIHARGYALPDLPDDIAFLAV